MKITDISLEKSDGFQELSALLDGKRLSYRIPSNQSLDVRADSFVIAGLLPAMTSGEDICVDPAVPVSPKLLEGIQVLQNVYSAWNPELRRVPIRATIEAREAPVPRCATFFSGGLDGIHTFLRHREKIDALIFVRGIDFTLTNEQLFREAIDSNSRFAARYEKTLIPVETNIREFSFPHTRISVSAYFGSMLAAVAALFRFKKTFLAAGLTYRELGSEGDFPFTWPLWASEGCTYFCDGAEFSRLEKYRFVAGYPENLDELRVCLNNTEYNCNSCKKCLTNRAMLRALGLTTKTLRPLDDLGELAKLRILSLEDLTFSQQTKQAAEAAGDRPLVRVLIRKIRQYQIRRILSQADRDFLRGAIRRRWRRRQRSAWKGPGVSQWDRLDFMPGDY